MLRKLLRYKQTALVDTRAGRGGRIDNHQQVNLGFMLAANSTFVAIRLSSSA